MKKSIITVFAITSILFSITIMNQEVYGPDDKPEKLTLGGTGYDKAIPDWVDQNFRWYGQGQISQNELLNAMKFLLDSNIMFISEKAAMEVQQLREDNQRYKELLGHELTHTIQQDGNLTSSHLLETDKDANESAAISTLRGTNEPTPFSCDGLACECQGNDDCWDMILSDSCLNDKLWCEDKEDGSYDCSCWENSTGDESGKFWLESLRPGVGGGGGNGDIIIIGPAPTPNVSDFEFASKTIDDALVKGGTASEWEKALLSYSIYSTQKGVRSSLEEIIVIHQIVIDKRALQIDAQVKIIDQWLDILSNPQEASSSYDASGRIITQTSPDSAVQYRESDLDFITRKLISIDQQVKSLDTGIVVLKQKLSLSEDDTQLSNIDLQNSLQKQQQTLQTISNVSKALHDTAMGVIRNMK